MAIDKIQSESINLADNFDFTGTVSGAGGITEADQWRLTASFTGSGDLTSNLERIDTNSPGLIGTGMSESSGIFTFPSTGVYLITAVFASYLNGSNRAHNGGIHVTTNNSSYTGAAANYTNQFN